jgi:hypothetical protein
MGWFVAALIIGATAKVVGGIIDRAQERKETTERAEYEKKKAEYNRDTNLGIMERQLTSAMENDYQQLSDLERDRDIQSRGNAQETFLGQLQAEDEMVKLQTSSARSMGELTATQGSSGAEEDLTVQTLINAEMRAAENSKRTQIDKGLGLATYQRQSATDAMKTQQNRIAGKYEEGGAVRNLYNYQRERETGSTTITTTYLNDVIADQDYWAGGWWAADLLGFAGEAASAGATYFGTQI